MPTKNPNQSFPASSKGFTFSTELGLIVLMLISVLTAALITFLLPDTKDNSNKDARNGLIGIVSTIITGCFALFQTTQQSASQESRENMDRLQAELNILKQQVENTQNSGALNTSTLLSANNTSSIDGDTQKLN